LRCRDCKQRRKELKPVSLKLKINLTIKQYSADWKSLKAKRN